ncbi:MAG TPA: Spi family protease inhibitor, partial [Candidatus Thermoplasmatota archaeon]|nr:Spi family protease inhibitor [Candidatus Thermoplasmatota archaeon]
MMFERHQAQKISVFIVVGLFLGLGIVPITNGNEIRIMSDDNQTITIDIATQVATAKLNELNKIHISIIKSTTINNYEGEPLFYIFNLKPQGYLVVSASYDLPPVIAYSFTNNFLEYNKANPLYNMLYSDITLRLENIQIIPERIIQERHLQWDSY